MSNNMKYWKSFEEVPSWALREITGGRLRGKSDVNPCWRMQVMTETFGPCGIGWRYTIEKIWTESGPQDQIMVFVIVHLFIKQQESWSDPIPGIGGSDLIAKESKGLYGNNESTKMALTDALSVAMKALGVGAKVYQGLWDGSKYRDIKDDIPHSDSKALPSNTSEAQDSSANQEAAEKLITFYQKDMTYADLQQRGKDEGNQTIIKGFSENLRNKVRAAFSAQLKEINNRNLAEAKAFLDSASPDQIEEYWEKMQPALKKYSANVQQKAEAYFQQKKDTLPF